MTAASPLVAAAAAADKGDTYATAGSHSAAKRRDCCGVRGSAPDSNIDVMTPVRGLRLWRVAYVCGGHKVSPAKRSHT